MKHLSKYIIIATIIGLFAVPACNSVKSASKVQLDPVAGGELFMGIYTNIFETNCFIPACHDGDFEPNFTTPQSTYYTIVMHDVIKNSYKNEFQYRIAPYDTAGSLLYERITNCCFIDKNDRMPVLMQPLTQGQIDSIAYWIMVGAPNWDGEFTYEELMAAKKKK